MGFNVETVQFKNIRLQVWDLGGQTSIRCVPVGSFAVILIFFSVLHRELLRSRPYWRCYYVDTSGIIYVVDSSDKERLGISGDALKGMLAEEELKGVPICIMANKQDVPGALPPEEVAEGLGMTGIKDRPWAIFKCSAVKNEGVSEGLDWIATSIMGS